MSRVQMKLQYTALPTKVLGESMNVNSDANNNTQITSSAGSATTSLKSAAWGGAGAGFFGRILSAPFDVIKIRMQLNATKSNIHTNGNIANNSLNDVLAATKIIYKEEGFVTFFRGNIPALCLWVGYGTIQFPVFAYLQEIMQQFNNENNNNTSSFSVSYVFQNTTIDFIAGCGGGLAATIGTHPLDVLRTRFAGQGLPKKYSTIWTKLRGTGAKGLYKGVTPALLYVSPSMGLTFSSYGFFRKYFSFVDGNPLICGALSGLVTKTVLYPLDIAKKRLQIQGIERNETVYGPNRKYKGMVNCIYTIVRKEGGIIHGLYKGFLPGVLKSIVSTAATFLFYEYIKDEAFLRL